MAPKKAGPPPMKKAKKEDPVKPKLDIVLKYLKDSSACDVEGPGTCRDMLIQALPHALGSGAASDERSAFQSNLGGFIGEVITASVAKYQGLTNDAQAVVDAAEGEKSAADLAQTEADTQVEAQEKVVEDTTAQSKESKEAEKEAEKALKVAEKAVASFEGEQEALTAKLTDAQSVLDEGFLFLKAGEWSGKFPKSKLDSVITLLTSIKTDASMLSALPLALKKKVGDRGKFDEMVISSSEAQLSDHVKAVDDTIKGGASEKAAREKAVEDAKKALEAATAKKEASLDALKFANEVMKGAEIHAKHAAKAVNEKASGVTKAKAKHAVQESALEKAQKVLDAFNFLKDRASIVPDDDEAGEAEPPASPSRLASLGSKVSGLFFSPKAEPKEEAEEEK
eukprot:gnl/MRDRNA2_/MRDRNA2_88839_c0_seq1.p1 gnl/MRDRNA2_/MRDRNA2_88839_c0~~gnl/MRDRNA2_/MRDRNA2_88839_c0_seq1.p1  ORF type:complete len:396 (-),score=140.99 gnl/MRDRNA2_/MRDRNA2_88839_c0_seq1:239-1426(-)